MTSRAAACLASRSSAFSSGRWARALSFLVESELGSSFLFEHDLFRKPVPTFRDHALVSPDRAHADDLGVGIGLAADGRMSDVLKVRLHGPARNDLRHVGQLEIEFVIPV